MIKELSYWEKEKQRVEHTLWKIKNKDWDYLPIDYKLDPQKAIKFFEDELKYIKEKLNGKQ